MSKFQIETFNSGGVRVGLRFNVENNSAGFYKSSVLLTLYLQKYVLKTQSTAKGLKPFLIRSTLSTFTLPTYLLLLSLHTIVNTRINFTYNNHFYLTLSKLKVVIIFFIFLFQSSWTRLLDSSSKNALRRSLFLQQ